MKYDDIEWETIVRNVLRSRLMDELEEEELVPNNETMYQFSAKGHELGQVVLGSLISNEWDAVSAYYRSRPLLISLGLSLADALAAPMARAGGYSDGRDIGVVCNMPGRDGPMVLPMAGDVGSQYTPAAGWAQALTYRSEYLGEKENDDGIAVVLGGDGSVATNGFWSALNIVTTLDLPCLFYIEDNRYGLSVPSGFQTPGGNIAKNLYSFKNLRVYDGDGSDPEEVADKMGEAVERVRTRRSPTLIRLQVPRLCGHAYHDNQAYKDEELIEKEWERDPERKLKEWLFERGWTERQWNEIRKQVETELRTALSNVRSRPDPDPEKAHKFVFTEYTDEGQPILQQQGGIHVEGHDFPSSSTRPATEGQRVNIVEAERRTLEYELETNDKLLVFGEDVGKKGGVHAVTRGLQLTFGEQRVFDTSLSEEGIVGRALGMAYAGLMPVAEIQFRKYADPATEPIRNCGTVRWRTANNFAAPMVIRMPGGFARVGDPWHSICNEVDFLHMVGWQLAFPSNAADAAGLLRSAMRSNNPTIFFEHRNLLDARQARRPYPGDQYVVPFGKANRVLEGDELTVVTWGAMLDRCRSAAEDAGISVDLIDLRTLMPWDRERVMDSLEKTNRCVIVHEDTITAGFGAEISAYLSDTGFELLDAPIRRVAMPDVPVPFNPGLMDAVMPTEDRIQSVFEEVVQF